MRAGVGIILFLAFGGAFLLSCASQKTPQPAETEPVVSTTPPGEAQASPPAADSQPAETATVEAQAAETAPQEAGSTAQNQETSGSFIVTEELYKKTFNEVEDTIASLNAIIAARQYDKWVEYLTTEYVKTIGSLAYLSAVSESAVLKKNGTVLKSLKDYFENVVVRSRSQARLDEISFVDKTHVKALSVVDGTPVILYWLVWEGGRWKVGIWQTGGE
jgi:hypothetical protein